MKTDVHLRRRGTLAAGLASLASTSCGGSRRFDATDGGIDVSPATRVRVREPPRVREVAGSIASLVAAVVAVASAAFCVGLTVRLEPADIVGISMGGSG